MSEARRICSNFQLYFGDEVTVVTSFKEVSGTLSSTSINVASVEQIRRRRSARLKGMALFVRKPGWQDE